MRSKVLDGYMGYVGFFFPLMEKCTPPPLFVLILEEECYTNQGRVLKGPLSNVGG